MATITTTTAAPEPTTTIVAPHRRSLAEPGLSALRMAQTPLGAYHFARALGLLLVVSILALGFLPWRQSVSGTGRVVGFAPLDREFRVEATVYGRIAAWHVREGTIVRGPRIEEGQTIPGDLIATISNNDPGYLEALEGQASQVRDKLKSYRDQLETYNGIVELIKSAREQAIEVARNDVSVAEQKLDAERREQEAVTAKYETDAIQQARIARLLPQGLASGREKELIDLSFRESEAKKQKAVAYVESAQIELQNKKEKLKEIEAKTMADVTKVMNDVQGAAAKVAEAEKERLEIDSKVRNQRSQEIRAPRDGVIQNLLVNQGAEQVKEGDPIARLVPLTSELAVEIWLDGNDTPLVAPGDPVRLQFEGWPAVQFAGWPSVAVGTFGGKVALIDPTDNGKGKFRILVVPDEGASWPSRRYLRQGVRANGWVLLREVQLGYEIWRRINGFPQVVADSEPMSTKYGKASDLTPDEPDIKEKVKVKRPK